VKLTKKNAQVHHLRPYLYDLLDPKLFKILSPVAHDFVEHMSMVLGGKSPFPNRELFLAWCGDFLPTVERKYGFPVKKD